MDTKLDEILNNFHLGKIDLIEVRKQLLMLYGVMLPILVKTWKMLKIHFGVKLKFY
jgi:hypothetical protein